MEVFSRDSRNNILYAFVIFSNYEVDDKITDGRNEKRDIGDSTG